ncbi:uncharacterized protein LOC129594974 [Paramacrobiotus metropolitanus]|uniref:uncharacterized protein LOC129594974 n=1 Tax=Paramacrobiotus metropolitanus TaxID=2943436 RepID=UPI00244655C8|nr:uncharacterized protein LOC129594974 [Paramacrobiotus metropolitanus]
MQRLLPKRNTNSVDDPNNSVELHQPPPPIPTVGLPTYILVPVAPVSLPQRGSRPRNRQVSEDIPLPAAAKKRRHHGSLSDVNESRTKLAKLGRSLRETSVSTDENCSDPNQCRRCVNGNDEPCVLHSRLISDTPTVARAYGSLPSQLYIAQKEGMLDPGVFAKRAIPHPSVFGPLLAPLTPHPVAAFAVDHRFGLREKKGSRGENAGVRVFDLKSDDLCNWIKFVREAVDAEQQNLVAFQQDDHVYLATTKDIPAETELCFWYSTKYCQLLNKENLSPESFTEGLSENNENEVDLSSRLENPAPAVGDDLGYSLAANAEGMSVNDENTARVPTAAASADANQLFPSIVTALELVSGNVEKVSLNVNHNADINRQINPGKKTRRVSVKPRRGYGWSRMEEHWLAEWFRNGENALQWQRAVESDAIATPDSGRRTSSDVAGNISQYLIQKGCFAFEADVIQRRIAKMQGKTSHPVAGSKKSYRAGNLEKNIDEFEVIPETSLPGLPASDPPEMTSPQRNPKKPVRRVEMAAACNAVNVSAEVPEIGPSEEPAKSAKKKRAKKHLYSKADEAALVDWLETDDNLEKWRNAGVKDPSAEIPSDNQNKATLARIAREWIVERCGITAGLFAVKSIKEKVAVMISDWNRANVFMQRTGREAVTLEGAWRLKRLGHESLPTCSDSLPFTEEAASINDGVSSELPQTEAVIDDGGDNRHCDEELVSFLSGKALSHRIWPPSRCNRSKKFHCRQGCTASFRKILTRDIHHLRHRSWLWEARESSPVCPECDFFAVTWVALCDHVDEEHRLPGPALRPIKSRRMKRIKSASYPKIICPYPKCEECQMEFISRTVREVHYWRHEKTLPVDTGEEQQCPACTFSTVRRSVLIAHVDERHSRKDLHQCPRCKRSFISYRRLERHIQHKHLLTDAEKPLECPTCHKKFSSNPPYVRHLKSHLGPDHISCPLCEAKFPKTPKLYEHMQQLHSVDGQLVCTICDKKFPIKCKESFRNFRIHARKHVESNECPCHICGKMCKSSSARSKHMEGVHSAGRHHVCDCGKSFPTRPHLRQHQKVVHQKDKVDGRKNATGGKSVAQNRDYVPPQKMKHFTEFPYQCEECQQGFVRRGMFAYHLTVRHPGRSLDAEPQLMLSSTAVHPNQ